MPDRACQTKRSKCLVPRCTDCLASLAEPDRLYVLSRIELAALVESEQEQEAVAQEYAMQQLSKGTGGHAGGANRSNPALRALSACVWLGLC